MSLELAAIAVNLSKIAAKARCEGQPLVDELVRELQRFCAVVQKLEQAEKQSANETVGCAKSA